MIRPNVASKWLRASLACVALVACARDGSSKGANVDSAATPNVPDVTAPVGDANGPPGDAGQSTGGATSGDPTTTDPFAATVVPAQNGDVWSLSFGSIVFEVNAAKGASVRTFSSGGHNVLADNGAMFRPAPQSVWGSTPPAEIEDDAYTPSTDGNVITMVGTVSNKYGIQGKRRFWANATSGIVSLEYTLKNISKTTASWAPWADDRINATGLTFFPNGQSINLDEQLPLTSVDGISWLNYVDSNFTAGPYIVQRDCSEGWMAHEESGLVFIKRFSDVSVSQIPPGQGEVQLYTEKTHAFLEMENMGPYVSLAPGASTVWTVRWKLVALPSTVTATVGSASLASFVRAQM